MKKNLRLSKEPEKEVTINHLFINNHLIYNL